MSFLPPVPLPPAPPEIVEFLKSFSLVFAFFKSWGWIFLPFILWPPFSYFWLWWRREIWFRTVYKPVILEIKIPKNIEKPIRAMETVMSAIHGVIYQPPDRWEKWIDGQVQTGVSFEIVSIGGEIHFFVRFHEGFRQSVEAAIYSQYPEAEIVEVEDYTKKVPQDIPNKEWDLWGADYRLIKHNAYPIKTYRDFETEAEAIPEKIVDPISNLLEGLSKIKPGEQFWLQIRATPIGEDVAQAFVKEGLALRDSLVKRRKPAPKKSIFREFMEILVFGVPLGKEKKEEPMFFPEMMLTPREREIVAEIERKLSKPLFSCGIRFIILGKRGVWDKSKLRIGFNFFNCFATQDLNALYPWGETITKIKKSIFFPPINLLRERRLYLRCRKMFLNYIQRANALYPKSAGDKSIFILNSEELASIFHLPSWKVSPVPGVQWIESKRKPPPSVPVEVIK
jgi:hypothetical protein